MNNFTFGGVTEGRGAFVYYETIAGGQGASPFGDGVSGRHSHMTNTRNTPVETLEYALPVRVNAYRLRDGSGGAGEHVGGDGITREYEFLAPAQVTINSERRQIAPYGLQGGEAGACGRNTLIRGGETIELSGKWTGQVQAGDRVAIETPGGGGFQRKP
jgi:N-methylhydantoinase B